MAQEKSSSLSSEATLWGAESGPFQMEKALTAWAQQREAQGLAGRELAVVFESLRVVGKGVAASYQSTVGSVLNPVTLLQYFSLLRRPPLRNIISGFYGVVNPGEMLLVLGQPGAGCSTFLKALTNHRSEYYAVDGTVQYSAFSWKDVAKHYRADLNYCPEDDTHFPTLTVEQTLDFAVRTRMPQRWSDHMNEPAQIHKLVRSIAAIVGLTHALNVRVGDAMIRGVSSGEKKRREHRGSVRLPRLRSSLGQRNAWSGFIDRARVRQDVRAFTDIFKVATAACIYQAGEPLYRQFDNVCVITEGGMIYFGPTAMAREYFVKMGFDPPARQTTADFLVAVTDPNERTARPGWENRVPRRVDEFVRYFDNSPTGRANRAAVDAFKAKWQKSDNAHFVKEYGHSMRMEQSAHAPVGSPYTLSLPKQIRVATLNIASGLLIGFTYFMPDNTQIGTQNMVFCLFVSLIIALPLSGQMQTSFVNFRSIWEVREGHSRTYHWSAFLVSHILTEIPWNIAGSTLFFLDIAIIFNGTIQPYRCEGWWKWVYRFSPLNYIEEGLVIESLGRKPIGCASNEFVTVEPPSGNTCTQYMQRFIQDAGGFLGNPDATSDCQFCPFSTTDQYLNTSFSMKYTHRWRNVGVTIGFILFNTLFYFLFTYIARVRTRRR